MSIGRRKSTGLDVQAVAVRLTALHQVCAVGGGRQSVADVLHDLVCNGIAGVHDVLEGSPSQSSHQVDQGLHICPALAIARFSGVKVRSALGALAEIRWLYTITRLFMDLT